MPVTGSFNTAQMVIGPVRIYLGVPVPADGAFLALTSGVPASGVLAGLTEEGANISFTYEESSEQADEIATPVHTIIGAENLAIEWASYQALDDMTLLEKYSPTGTYVINSGATEGMKFGGIASIPSAAKPSVLVVGALRSDPTKYLAVQLFSAVNVNGVSWSWTRKKSGNIPVRMVAQPIASRTAGNTSAMIWKTLA